MSLPLISRLRSGWCHGGGGVLRGERELLLPMLKHLPAENSVSEAVDFILFLVAQTARGLHKNRDRGIDSALFLLRGACGCRLCRECTSFPSPPPREDRIKNSLDGDRVAVFREEEEEQRAVSSIPPLATRDHAGSSNASRVMRLGFWTKSVYLARFFAASSSLAVFVRDRSRY